MEGNKILDLSKLSDEHFNSVQKAVYRCMGSDDPGSFNFTTHKEWETTNKLLEGTFKHVYYQGANNAVVGGLIGLGVAIVIGKTIQYVVNKKKKKELTE